MVAGLGGNSLAGANVMDQIIRSGPWASKCPRAAVADAPCRRRHLPPVLGGATSHDNQGSVHEQRPVALSHGEYVVKPQDVMAWGDGDKDSGHRIWDHFIMAMRKHNIADLKGLPGPVGMKKAA